MQNVHSIYFNLFLVFYVWFFKGEVFADMFAPSFIESDELTLKVLVWRAAISFSLDVNNFVFQL